MRSIVSHPSFFFYVLSHPASIDFSAMLTSLRFSSSVSQQCINVSITDDAELENDEMFSVNISTSDTAVSLNPASALVTISDNDGMCTTV